jgi:hypothetical protein
LYNVVSYLIITQISNFKHYSEIIAFRACESVLYDNKMVSISRFALKLIPVDLDDQSRCYECFNLVFYDVGPVFIQRKHQIHKLELLPNLSHSEIV